MPLIISWPGQFMEGVRRQALVELLDIAPTLLDLAGVQIPKRMQGISLRTLLTNDGAEDHHRDSVRCEYYSAINPNFAETYNGTFATMIRDERYKLVVYHGHAIGELFDLEADPDEFVNLWDDESHVGTKMRLLIKSFDAMAFATDTGTEQVTWF